MASCRRRRTSRVSRSIRKGYCRRCSFAPFCNKSVPCTASSPTDCRHPRENTSNHPRTRYTRRHSTCTNSPGSANPGKRSSASLETSLGRIGRCSSVRPNLACRCMHGRRQTSFRSMPSTTKAVPFHTHRGSAQRRTRRVRGARPRCSSRLPAPTCIGRHSRPRKTPPRRAGRHKRRHRSTRPPPSGTASGCTDRTWCRVPETRSASRTRADPRQARSRRRSPRRPQRQQFATRM
jgi:hypothetical protein